jgi:hypothetical protein
MDVVELEMISGNVGEAPDGELWVSDTEVSEPVPCKQCGTLSSNVWQNVAREEYLCSDCVVTDLED